MNDRRPTNLGAKRCLAWIMACKELGWAKAVTDLPPLSDEERYKALVEMEKQAHAEDQKA